MKIVQIDWISREALEAEVTLTDGSFDVVCFAHPFIGKVGEIINQEISTLNSDQIYRMQDTEYLVEKLADPFAYRLSGKVLNKKMPLVQIGDFKIILDNNLPGDLEEGQYVSFICDRLDID